MKVFFVRHGQSVGNEQGRHCGWSQTPLSVLGREQAKEARAYLEDVSFDRVYCSDLLRARQTCEEALPGASPILSEKLREISVGELMDRLYADCARDLGEVYIKSERAQDFSLFGGESQEQMHARLQSFFHELEKLENVENVAVFGHEGTVHQMLNYVLGQDIPLQKLCISNASVTAFTFSEGQWSLLAFNYRGKLCA